MELSSHLNLNWFLFRIITSPKISCPSAHTFASPLLAWSLCISSVCYRTDNSFYFLPQSLSPKTATWEETQPRVQTSHFTVVTHWIGGEKHSHQALLSFVSQHELIIIYINMFNLSPHWILNSWRPRYPRSSPLHGPAQSLLKEPQ